MATKDYVKRGRSPKKPARPNRKAPASNGFPIKWAIIALLLVSALGYGLYFLSSSPAPKPAPEPTKPVAVKPKPKPITKAKETALPPKPEEKWHYIEELENKEIQVESKQAEKPGRPYLMQCGAYRSKEQAEQRKAMIAFQGLESQVKTSQGEKGNWYRVILGPYPQKRKAESDRNMLRRAGIEPCAIWFWE
ncbi:SPOR domain-containing protein [Photobacterium lipolyticum]|uniref:Cell division protein n=1 Tax=Photobacterium lipolyticum TaxID=266810 RepID=A0A2T3MY46_9GAMM|nr:SPOR domain-containing protein [Photobacterium lipolyticum]PSW04887.1 cell division protein [Photobacterium lipolyticum]